MIAFTYTKQQSAPHECDVNMFDTFVFFLNIANYYVYTYPPRRLS